MNKVFEKALPIIETIERAGYEAYFVGGSVRDSLMGRNIHDVDIAVSATPDEVKSLFPATADVGIEHGTVLVIHGGEAYEVTTFREESDYVEYRRPESVSFIRSLEEDLKRRDFTMNAIAMDRHGRYIDPFGGREDIAAKKIRTVGSADERFREDALRLMRAARFVSQLGFRLDGETEAAMKKHAPLLAHIAVERMAAEMVKLLEGKEKAKGLSLLLSSGLYRHLPSVFSEDGLIRKMLEHPVAELTEEEAWGLALILSGTPQPAESLKKWRMPMKKVKRLTALEALVRWRENNSWTPYAIYLRGLGMAKSAEAVFQAWKKEPHPQKFEELDQMNGRLPILSRSDLAVSGADLLAWSEKKAGPWVSAALAAIEEQVAGGSLANEKEEIRRWLETCRFQFGEG